jgi:hypothetical protein
MKRKHIVMDSEAREDIGILLLPPEVYAGVGRFLIVIWLISNVVSVVATAAFFLGQSVGSVLHSYSGLMLDYHTYFALGFGLFVQSILLAAQISIGYIHAMIAREHGETAIVNKKMLRNAKMRKIAWNTLSNLILLFNYIAEVLVFQDLGEWQSSAFCLMLFVCNFFLGVFGVQILWANKSKRSVSH